MKTMKNTNEYDNLVERSKEEALEKLRSDQLLKKQLKSLTYEKEKEIDFLYEKYENNMKELFFLFINLSFIKIKMNFFNYFFICIKINYLLIYNQLF